MGLSPMPSRQPAPAATPADEFGDPHAPGFGESSELFVFVDFLDADGVRRELGAAVPARQLCRFGEPRVGDRSIDQGDRKSTRLNSSH